jgi:putative Holliday junction resolvase
MGRLVGLDVGDARIGVAVADELGFTAQALGVVRRSNLTDDLRRLGEFLADYPPERFVVGLPLNMNGSVGPQAQKVQAFARELERHFRVPVDTWDERLTTFEANCTLTEIGVSGRKRRGLVDKLAAALILKGYMDHQAACR